MTSDLDLILAVALGIAIIIGAGNAKTARKERQSWLKAERDLQQKDAELIKARDHAQGMEKIYEERKIAFPWLASAYADFHALEAERDAQALETKKHRAIKSANVVRDHGERRRKAERLARWSTYRVAYFQSLFPWLVEYIGDDIPDYAVQASETIDSESVDDPVRAWLPPGEYEKLSTAERNQMALGRWKAKTKRSNWEIGRLYERFIGYTYETNGHDVEFIGAVAGFADMGRDLICRHNGPLGMETRLIQCKYWRPEKLIHEKHVFQLFGSAMEYAFSSGLPLERVKPVLHTSTKLSDVAKKAAELLRVEFHENFGISDYPLIKCNVAKDGERIYHLPFDQQYDRCKIRSQKGERYCYTVKEAEDAGFRRAWRWRSQQSAA